MSHKKIMVSSTKFTILISWSLICIPLVILSVLMKLVSILIAIMYNSMESRQTWPTRVMVKRLGRRLFILNLDSISVYHVSEL